MNYRNSVVVFAFCLCVPGASFAQAPVPERGIIAESDGRWEDALRTYRDVLEREPNRAELWVRVADISARLGRPADVTSALSKAAEASPSDPALHFRLSQAHAAQNNPAAAVASLDRALALRPNEPEYVRAAAVLATWSGDYRTAATRYHQLQALQPENTGIALDLAHVSAWSGDTTEAVNAYRRYLGAHPDAADVWIELATAETWRGRYSDAFEALNVYRVRFGESRAYSLALARVLAGAGRPSRAVDLLEPLRQQNPIDYDVTLARTIAFTLQRSIRDAHTSLNSLQSANPTSVETRNAERLVRAMIGSSVEPSFTYYGDSDDLQVVRMAPAGSLMLPSGTRLSAGFARYLLEASPESGLDLAAGGTAILDQTWGGLAQSFGGLTVSGRIGTASAQAKRRTENAVDVLWRISDTFTAEAGRSDTFVAISPRTVELGITEERYRTSVLWTPTFVTSLAVDASYRELSDGNDQSEIRVSPRRAFVRTQSLNVDLGLSAYQLRTSRDMSNGYYDPRRYEAYQATAYPYFKVSENVGVGLSFAAGVQREQRRPFRFGGSAAADATVGIYQAWLLRITASSTHNLRQASGAFQGFSGSVALTRRF